MKAILQPVLIFITIFAIGFYSKAQNTDQNGNWEDNSTWGSSDGETSPGVSGLKNKTISIDHVVYAGKNTNSGLGFVTSNGGSITINDTLIIYGDVTFANKSMDLNINGAVIILGNLTLNNKVNITSAGTLVVTDQISKSGSSGQGSYSGTGIVYAGSYDSGADAFIPGDNTNTDQQQTLSDLQTDNSSGGQNAGNLTDIINFINDNGNVPLPITLQSMIVTQNQNTIELNWSTVSEENFEYFIVQRANQSGDFETLTTIPGSGHSNSLKSYTWSDEDPNVGINYYRLISHDFDGYEEVFPAKVFVFSPKELPLDFYPNPMTIGEEMKITGAGRQSCEIEVFNLNGEMVFSGKTDSNSIQLEGLNQGMYLIKLNANGLVKSSRILIR